MGISLPCAVHPDQSAILDAEHRALVNYEAYYFGSSEAQEAFVAEPWKYTGKVTDPVSRERFVPTAESPVRTYGGRIFFLQSAETATTFDNDPPRFGVPRPTMSNM
jgi:YHS domain-containing protein